MAGPPRSQSPHKPHLLARLNHSPNLGRSALLNHYRRTVDALAPTHSFPELSAFLPQHLSKWISTYLKYALTKRYPFPGYPDSGNNGVYPIAPEAGTDKIVMAIAGDWGTGTQEAQAIADLMCNKPDTERPDLTIHLGDVYYIGDEQEIEENCFGKDTNGYRGVQWPHGRRGSFSLNGNHEMYANGKPYFTAFLPTLGLAGSAGGQLASFFSIETEHWRIIAIDTAYNSVGIPILSQLPGLSSISWIGGDCHLDQKQLDWLRDTVKPKENRKATLLLSHHQYFTAFPDHAYPKPAQQLMEFFAGQDVVWLWGHEHRMGIYDKFSVSGGITAYGRCVGHGGMPVDLGTPDRQKAPLRYYDPRQHPLDDGTQVGTNGFVLATIQGDNLTLEYRDIDNTQLLVETFRAGANGMFSYSVSDPAGILAKM